MTEQPQSVYLTAPSDEGRMRDALLRCPFCGLRGFVESHFGRDWWVQCESGHSTGIMHTNEVDAIEEWNRRAVHPAEPLAPTSEQQEVHLTVAANATVPDDELAALREALAQWEGEHCGGDCIAAPCTFCDGTQHKPGAKLLAAKSDAYAEGLREAVPESDALDARRYRFMRQLDAAGLQVYDGPNDASIFGDELDAAIDAAMIAAAPPTGNGVQPDAWLHTVKQHGGDGTEDLALSFNRDSFPLQGVEHGMFYSVAVAPLYRRAP